MPSTPKMKKFKPKFGKLRKPRADKFSVKPVRAKRGTKADFKKKFEKD